MAWGQAMAAVMAILQVCWFVIVSYCRGSLQRRDDNQYGKSDLFRLINLYSVRGIKIRRMSMFIERVNLDK